MLTEALKQEFKGTDFENALHFACFFDQRNNQGVQQFLKQGEIYCGNSELWTRLQPEGFFEPLFELAEARKIRFNFTFPKERFDLVGDEFESYCFSYNLNNLQETVVFFEKNLTEGLARLIREIKAYPVV
jgi:hypothetical protein